MKRNYSGAPIMSTYRASRLPVSCRPCREKKRRCDRNQPCSNCTQRRLTCVYENGSRATNPLETDTLPERNPGEASVDPNGSTLAFSPLRQLDLNKEMLDRLTKLEKAVFPNGAQVSQLTQPEPTSSHHKPFNCHNETPSSDKNASINARLNHLTSNLPPAHQAHLLCEHFVDTIQPTFGVLHVPSTRSLVCSSVDSDKEVPKIDELLLLFSIFAGAALAWTDELLHRLEATKENAVSAFDCYFHSALSIIEEPCTPLPPSVTAVSAISTLAHVAINSDDVVPAKALDLRSRCYNMCREMMIHRLDSPAAQKERVVSPANNIDLEVQRRVWWNMVASDWLTSFSGSSQEGIYTFIPRLLRVKQPRNVDDVALTISGDIPDLPISVPTDMTFFFLRLRTAEISREIIDTITPLADDTPEEDYEVILQLDRKLQNFIKGLPDFCKLDPESMQKSKEICELRPFIYWQRISLHLGIHARICRLHRPYHLAAYSDLRYSYSRTTILTSAYKILELRRMMDDPVAKLHFRPERYLVIFLHVTSAAVALAVDLSHNPDAPDAEAIKEKVKGAYETLNKSRKNAESLIRGIEKNMEQVMGTLQKQRTNAMKSASPAATSSANLDSVPESAFTDMNDITVGMQEDGFGDEHSHQLWSDFLAAVPDLEEFQWTSLLQDLDFDPSNFS
ncbi:uncharacterized protein FOBCDRAFT_286891 [Fusarium oxysporum Fo47]|uniref:Zn(2)-C6 fungal-type domain-containing protein n=1 Tax=Fusarium oxysporum Fo47 TaxID=660027 RepID=W9JMI8_FUSOX|nr:uncharacterized protein FOBCDRAFT_286891 [Fusarium oxysporum Fo47]EWZ33252.1 hypothetical protein FOZG_13013 [Fusarium oxysporum Fo47]QKD62547.2 hypothetical protein FOBCDRAFT_286891 [Fusarium oxysporum Fo47]